MVFARGDGAMQLLIDRTGRCDGGMKVLDDRSKQLLVWLQMVRVAEDKYKTAHGHYAELADLRKAHLLDELVFESDSARSNEGKSTANYVPATTIFEVIVSSDGAHFRASIHDKAATVSAGDEGGWSIGGWSIHDDCPSPPILDGPQGPAFEGY